MYKLLFTFLICIAAIISKAQNAAPQLKIINSNQGYSAIAIKSFGTKTDSIPPSRSLPYATKIAVPASENKVYKSNIDTSAIKPKQN
jgi:hypothetical protein